MRSHQGRTRRTATSHSSLHPPRVKQARVGSASGSNRGPILRLFARILWAPRRRIENMLRLVGLTEEISHVTRTLAGHNDLRGKQELRAVFATALRESGVCQSRKRVDGPTIGGQRKARPVQELWQPMAASLSSRGVRDDESRSGTEYALNLGKRLRD